MKIFLFVAAAIFASSASAADVTFSSIDQDHNGTIEEKEAQTLGGAAFARLDANKDGKLAAAEIEGRLTPDVLKAADPNKDGGLNAEEYAALVTARFKLVNTNADGKVGERELASPAGDLLLIMLK